MDGIYLINGGGGSNEPGDVVHAGDPQTSRLDAHYEHGNGRTLELPSREPLSVSPVGLVVTSAMMLTGNAAMHLDFINGLGASRAETVSRGLSVRAHPGRRAVGERKRAQPNRRRCNERSPANGDVPRLDSFVR